ARLMYVAVESSRYLAAETTPEVERYLAAEDRGQVATELFGSSTADLDMGRRLSVGYDFLHQPLKFLKIWEGGLVMYGGVFGAALLGMYAARRKNLHPLNALDTALPAAFVGQAIGRWGCLLVGDDYGSIVPPGKEGLPFPLTIQVPGAQWLQDNPESLFGSELAGKTLWATQPWMSANALLVALLAVVILKRRRWYGQVAAAVMLYYSISRFTIEYFRGDEIRGMWFGDSISTSQLIAIPGAVIGLVLLARFRKRD
ncbi:MAG: prolipoprotein diacylglyceryl transferase, partial [bacterium]|nr:prolipoprotein diacylglyceryl transferase [bacterium]